MYPKQPLVSVDDVTFSYHDADVPVFENVSLTITSGEISGIIGRSGAGKSTLLRLLSGDLQPLSGSIRIDSPAGVRIPVLLHTQEPKLLPWKSVAENATLGLQLLGVAPVLDVASVLNMLGLASRESAFPSRISGGQAERLALARTLLTPANAYLLDEPLGGTDYSLRLELEQFLRRIVRDYHVGMAYVTHDISQALAISDTIHVFQSGRDAGHLRAIPVPDELIELDGRSRRVHPRFGEFTQSLIDLMEAEG